MEPLTLEETRLKEEMKARCLSKGQYKDENAKAKFKMLCHLEDFAIQYWELKEENDTLKKRIKDAIEYNQEDINQIKEFYKSTHEIIYSGDAIIDIAKITIAILKGKKNE